MPHEYRLSLEYFAARLLSVKNRCPNPLFPQMRCDVKMSLAVVLIYRLLFTDAFKQSFGLGTLGCSARSC